MVGLLLRPIPSKSDLKHLPSTLKKNITNYVKRRSKSISKKSSSSSQYLTLRPIINHSNVRPVHTYPDQQAHADFATFPTKPLFIPTEIILHIFSYCSWEDYESFSSINRLWRQCAFDVLLAKRYVQDEETPFATHSIFQTLLLHTIDETRFVPTARFRFDGLPIAEQWRGGIHNSPYMSEPASFPPLSLIRCHIYEAQWYGKFYWCYSRAFNCYSEAPDRVVTVGHLVERIRQEYAREMDHNFMLPYTMLRLGDATFHYDQARDVWHLRLFVEDRM